jgi:peroxiredoxin
MLGAMDERDTNQGGTALPQGTEAPAFELRAGNDERVGPSSYRGRPLIIAFYPLDWSPVCSDQLALYQQVLPMFEELGAALIAISVDSAWCHRAFAEDRHLTFPLLADFEPKGEVARRYGVYREGDGFSERALYVLDPQGRVHWSHVSPPEVNPGAEGILRALGDLHAGATGTAAS